MFGTVYRLIAKRYGPEVAIWARNFILHKLPAGATTVWNKGVTYAKQAEDLYKTGQKYQRQFNEWRSGAKPGKNAAKWAGGHVDRFITASEARVGNWAAGPNRVPGSTEWGMFGYSQRLGTNFLGERSLQRATFNLLYPRSRVSGFASGFVRGAGRSTGSQAFNFGVDALLGVPSKLTKYPQSKKFVTSFAREFKRARGMSNMNTSTFGNLVSAYKKANKEAAQFSRLGQAGFDTKYVQSVRRYERAGAISGRIGVIGAGEFVFVDEETREKNVQRFRKTFGRDVKKTTRTYVNAHTRDGRPVKAHWRTVVV